MKKTIRKRARAIRIITAGALTLCMIAGSLPFADAAYAASGFTSKTPFSGTYYGTGTGDSTYTHDGSYAGNLIVNGVDVSWWQEDSSDWTKAKSEGVDFAIARVSYTSLSNPFRTINDTRFDNHYKKLRKAGVDLIGVYAYSQAKTENEAAAEARFAIKRLKALGIGPEDLELPVYMDYEFGGGRLRSNILSRTIATKCAKAFCEVVRNAGYKPGIYASTNFFNTYINIKSLGSDVDIWCAQYNEKNTLSPVYSKWQYSSLAKIDGIISANTGKVGSTDVDFWYVDQTKNTSSKYKIYGNTYLTYTGNPVKPSFDIYYGATLLTEGKDYTVCGISNIGDADDESDAYAYIQGIGKYSGYAVVPFKIKSSYKARIGLDNEACEDADGIILSNRHIFEEVTSYLVRFVGDDGKDIVEPAYYQSGTAAADMNVPLPEKEGFIFAGWLDEEGVLSSSISGEVTGPATYTAVFEQKPESDGSDEAPIDGGEGTLADGGAGALTGESADAEATTEDADAVTEDADPAEELPPEKTELVDTGETYLDLDIGYTSNGSYVRNVPAGTTAADLTEAVEIREGYDDYSVKVLTASRYKRSGAVKTGDVLAVYKGKKLVGTADITVNGSTINDTGSVHLRKASAAKVTVAKTSVKKLKKYRKAFKVTVAKKSSAYVSGYQVRYSLKKSMAGAKTKTVGTSYSRVTKKITGLKAKKKYYVQVRSYKTVNGKKYYSSWSSVKSVKTK